MSRGSATAYGWASLLFLISGATGLAYEVIWFKRLSHVWGNSSLAVASVVASFLLGLGLGAWLFGRVSDRLARPLFWYGVCEVGIGLLAVLVPLEIQLMAGVSAGLYPVLQDRFLLHFAVRLVLTLLLIGPACVLMGGTLPLLTSQFARHGVGRTAAWLYAVNTLGAALGCYATGFHLLPSLGLPGANALAVASNGAVGAAAMLLAHRLSAGARVAAPPPAPVSLAALSRVWPVYAAAALSGAASLILQMVWTRQLTLVLGGSTYAFTAALFIVLVGIGLGSLVYHLWMGRLAGAGRLAGLVILVLTVGTLAGRELIPSLTYGVALAAPFRASQTFNALTCIGASLVLELAPALAMGVLFPLLVHLTHEAGRSAGRAVGNPYTWNVLGTVLGAALTSYLVIPTLGAAGATALAAGLYGLALLAVAPWSAAGQRVLNGLALVGVGISAELSSRPADPSITDAGMFMYGWGAAGQTVFFREGATCNVHVTDSSDNRTLRVNGKADGSIPGDMATQLGLAYFARFLVPEASRVLVIGYGTGTTAGASLLFAGTDVTCCEIEPAVYQASVAFTPHNHAPDRQERFRIIFDDARSALQGMAAVYDLIISEPSNPWMAGVASLMTREFYQTVHQRLAPGGLLAQWVQAYDLTAADYALLLRTVTSVFPHVRLVVVDGSDTILLASPRPLALSRQTVEAAQALVDRHPPVRTDLKRFYDTTDVRRLLLSHLLWDEAAAGRFLRRHAAPTLNTDGNLRLEFDAPLRLFAGTRAEGDLLSEIAAAADASWWARCFREWACTREHLVALHRLVTEYRHLPLAADLVAFGLSQDPADAFFRAERLLRDPPADMDRLSQAAAELAAVSPLQAGRVGTALWQARKLQPAAAVFEGIRRVHPSSAMTLANLAVIYEALDRWDLAEPCFQEAIRCDPVGRPGEEAYQKARRRRQAAP